jgi:hypothetical protein
MLCAGSFLDASQNWLTTVPRNLCRCTKLVTVLLNQNRITQVRMPSLPCYDGFLVA